MFITLHKILLSIESLVIVAFWGCHHLVYSRRHLKLSVIANDAMLKFMILSNCIFPRKSGSYASLCITITLLENFALLISIRCGQNIGKGKASMTKQDTFHAKKQFE